MAAGFPRAALVDHRDGVEIDWAAGTVTASGGAAADLRMPSADVARAGSLPRAVLSTSAYTHNFTARGRRFFESSIKESLSCWRCCFSTPNT